jgi:hypothetical protein
MWGNKLQCVELLEIPLRNKTGIMTADCGIRNTLYPQWNTSGIPAGIPGIPIPGIGHTTDFALLVH